MMSFIALGFNAMTKTIVAITPKAAVEYTQSQKDAYSRAQNAVVHVAGQNFSSSDILSYEELLRREQLELCRADKLEREESAELAILRTKAPAKIISHLSENALIWIVCLVVLIYAVAGGLEAAFITDMLQGIFIIILSVMLIPFAWAKINAVYGGQGMMDALRTIHARLPEEMFDIFGSPHSIDFTWFYILALSVLALLVVFIQPNMLVATGSARDEYAARYGFTVGSFMKRFCTVLWGMFALAAVVLYGNEVRHPDLVWGYASRDLLGPLHLGLVGLMISALMSALMSTADCLMLTCASLLTHNLYEPLAPNHEPRHYVWAGRFFGAVVLIGSVLIATQFDTILQLLKFIWEFNVMLIAAFWLGLKWRRANHLGAWASIILAGLGFVVMPILVPVAYPGLRSCDYLLKTTNPSPLVADYRATQGDVQARNKAIARWEEQHMLDRAEEPRPASLSVGQEFQKTYSLPRKSIFWTQGIATDENGRPQGHGRLNLDLLILDLTVWNLDSNSYALNETIRILIRVILPFAILFFFSYASRPDDQDMVARFYAKMRTKVIRDREADQLELDLSLADTDRHKSLLLFPHTNWEFYRWNREDAGGFLLSIVTVGCVLLVMKVFVSLGQY